MQPDLARHIDERFGYDEGSIRVAVDDLHRMFPSFADVPIEAGWGGPIDVSSDHLPFFWTVSGKRVHYGLGYSGHGVGPTWLGGQILASLVLPWAAAVRPLRRRKPWVRTVIALVLAMAPAGIAAALAYRTFARMEKDTGSGDEAQAYGFHVSPNDVR